MLVSAGTDEWSFSREQLRPIVCKGLHQVVRSLGYIAPQLVRVLQAGFEQFGLAPKAQEGLVNAAVSNLCGRKEGTAPENPVRTALKEAGVLLASEVAA